MTADERPGPTAESRIGRMAVAWLLSGGAVVVQMQRQFFDPPSTVLIATALMSAFAIAGTSTDAHGVRRGVRIALGMALAWMAWRWDLLQADLVPVAVLVAVGIAIVAEVLDGPTGDRIAARWLTAAAISVLGSAAIAVVSSWTTVRNFGVVFLAIAAGAVATGAADLGPGRRRAGRASVVLVPSVAGALILVAQVGIRLPTLVVGLAAAGVAAMVLIPSRWAVIERGAAGLVRPLDLVLATCDRLGAWVATPFAAFARWSWPRLQRLFVWIGHGLAMVLMTAVWVLVVALPWAFQRITRWDPLRAPTTRGSRWVPLVAATPRSDAAWAPEHADPVVRRPIARRHLAISVLTLALLALVWREFPRTADEGDAAPRVAAFMGQTELDAANGELMAKAQVRLYAGTELPDYASPHLNVTDGIRQTWQPPIDRCDERFVVWLFGGSTAFGIAQADDETIASHLAKQAWDEDLPLAIENRAIPGDVAWQEHARLQQALTTTDHPPDLVVFYDGFNDLLAQSWATAVDDGGVGTFRTLTDSDLMPLLSNVEVRTGPDQATYTAEAIRSKDFYPDYAESIPASMFQYSAADRWSLEALDQLDVPMVRFFQPSRVTAGRRPGDTNKVWDQDLADAMVLAREALPTGIIDIADALDDLQGDYWIDTVHTTEVANPTIAAAILDELRPRLDTIDPAKDPSCS